MDQGKLKKISKCRENGIDRLRKGIIICDGDGEDDA